MGTDDDLRPAVRVVLVWPDENRNIGAACRAMKTMGIRDLAIVPGERRYEPADVAITAVHAFDIFEHARYHDSVDEAVADCTFSVAYTRRRGRNRKYSSATPEAIAERIERNRGGGTTALVFGNEEHGLTNEQVDACHVICRIPTAPECPSLNLAQAVQLACYTIFRRTSTVSEKGTVSENGYTPLDAVRIDELADEVDALVSLVGYSGDYDRQTNRIFARDLLARATLTPTEGRRLKGLLRKLRYGLPRRE